MVKRAQVGVLFWLSKNSFGCISFSIERSEFGETIKLYCLWLGGDRSSPWLNELHTEFVYLLLLSSSDLGFTTVNF